MNFWGALHSNYCSYGSIILQPLIAEVEVEDSQEQAEKPAARGIDSLVNTPLLSMEDILKVRRLCIIFGILGGQLIW